VADERKQWLTTAAGVKMPPIIYGTAWKEDRTADLVVQAVRAGFRGIDTACQPKHYNEPQVGEALRRLRDHGIPRESLFLQTKFTPLSGQDPLRVPYDRKASIEEQVTQSFETSKKNLQTEYVDSLVLHSPVAPYTALIKLWRAMENIQKAGGARQLGISNCYDPELFKALYDDAEVKPAVIQNRFYQATGYDTDLRRYCAEQNVIYQSFWTLTANPHILDSKTVRFLAERHRKTVAQIFFRFLTRSGIVPLTGTCSGQHMKEGLGSFDFELTPDELEDVSNLI
jgi:diketogulonate reductase-like aldo/keto reductase